MLIKCACGCGNNLLKYNKYGIERKYIKGHTNKNKKFSEESKKKMSDTRKRLFKEGKLKHGLKGLKGELSHNYGRKHTEETKTKISESKKGKKLSKEHKLKISKNKERALKISISKKRKKLSKEHCKNISKSQKGRKMLEAQKRKISKSLKGRFMGVKSPNWQGGKSFEPYSPSFNNKFRRAIRKRDNYICMMCGKHQEKMKKSLHIHHINYDKLLSIKENCISLCINCHGITGKNRNHWTQFFQNLLEEKYGYKYEEKEVIIKI